MAALDSNILDDIWRDETRTDLARCHVNRAQCRAALAHAPGNAVLKLQIATYDRWITRYNAELLEAAAHDA